MFEKLKRRLISWLYQIIEQERARLEVAKTAEKDAAQVKQATEFLEETKKRQNLCRHAKGGNRFRASHIDYAISQHTFADGSEAVRCLICGKKWVKENGEWPEEVKDMLFHTTNHPSSSEQVFEIKDQIFPASTREYPQEKENVSPLAPFVSEGYIELWKKWAKKLKRRKK